MLEGDFMGTIKRGGKLLEFKMIKLATNPKENNGFLLPFETS